MLFTNNYGMLFFFYSFFQGNDSRLHQSNLDIIEAKISAEYIRSELAADLTKKLANTFFWRESYKIIKL